MKSLAGNLVLMILLLPALAYGANLGVDGMTLFQFEQRSVPGFSKKTVVPATQFLGVDMDKVGSDSLSFHLYGWGRVDLADDSTNEGTTDGDLTYGYLLYRFPKANGQVKGGRFFIYEGVAAEQIDGVSARADLAQGFTVSLFGGVPVKPDWNSKSKGDYIFGGRASYRLAGILEFGVSGLQEGNVTVNATTGAEKNRQMIGGDIWLSPHRMVELVGHTYYDASYGGMAENSYLLTLKPLKGLSISGDYNKQLLRYYFAFTNLPSLFKPLPGTDMQSYGASVTYAIAKPVELTADYKHFEYESPNHGNTDRYGIEARMIFMENALRTGLSYHRCDAHTAGINSYHEVRGYGLYTVPKYFASLDVIAHFYDDPIYTKDTDYEVTASAGYRFMPNLTLSGDISYGENPFQTEELKGLIRLTFNFTTENKGAK